MIDVGELHQEAQPLQVERSGRSPRFPYHPRSFRKIRVSRNRSQPPRNARLGEKSRTSQEGPFGEVIRQTGPAASENVYRFSAKYTDPETGLIYYGRRYLQLPTGRWLSKDPMGERGGKNLYGMVKNNPVRFVDPFGQNVYVAYRPLALDPPGDLINKKFPAAGHVYLYFNTLNMGSYWSKALQDAGKAMYSGQMKTFSRHPLSVRAGATREDNLLSVIITVSNAIIEDDVKNDITPISEGRARLYKLTTKECDQIALFKKAVQSEQMEGEDIGPYSFLINNCGSWVRFVIQNSGATTYSVPWNEINAGAGTGGTLDNWYATDAAYAVALAVLTLKNTAEILVPNSSASKGDALYYYVPGEPGEEWMRVNVGPPNSFSIGELLVR